jgi:hypothetical protein
MRTTDDETNWLPFTVSSAPFSMSVKGMLLGERKPISGAGRALPQNGLRVLLQPGNNKTESKPTTR